MALTKDEINFYNDQGYLLVEDVISENQHKDCLLYTSDAADE